MNRVVHFELSADQPERAIEFYQTVFSWKAQKWDGPIDYRLLTTGEEGQPGIDGGLMQRQEASASVVNTIAVDSVDQFTEKITSAGGKIVQPKMAIPTIGYLAYCQDPEGNPFGIMEMDENAS